MRTTDPEPVPRPVVGERVAKAPAPAPRLQQVPVGPSGIVTDADGRMRTTTHKEPK